MSARRDLVALPSAKIGAMTQIPAGWYPDPDPDAPEPKGQRWWDGRQWTEHLQPAQPQPTAHGAGGLAPGYAPLAPYGGGVQIARATTPDGQVLAGWWVRVAAYLLDGIVVGILTAIIGFPWISRLVDAYAEFFDEAFSAAERGSTQVPGQSQLMADIAGPVLTLTLVGLAVSFVYHAAFLKWKAATPGKLAVGLRVRLRETPGPLGWGTIVKRWLGQFGYSILTLIPVLGGLFSLYPLLDGLWPLWDSRKQALHDKIAATNVVRQR